MNLKMAEPMGVIRQGEIFPKMGSPAFASLQGGLQYPAGHPQGGAALNGPDQGAAADWMSGPAALGHQLLHGVERFG